MKPIRLCALCLIVVAMTITCRAQTPVTFFNDTPTIEAPAFISSHEIVAEPSPIPPARYAVGQTVSIRGNQYIVQSRFYDGTEWKYKLGKLITADQLVSTSSSSFQLKQTPYDNRRWTYPGSIDDHLQGGIHQVPAEVVASLTPQQRITLHNQLHGSRQERFSDYYGSAAPVRVSTPVAYSQPIRYIESIRYSSPSVSSCPGGVCPTPTRTTTYRSNCPGGVCPTR